MNRRSVIFCCLILFFANSDAIAQNILPGKNEILKHRISKVIVSEYTIANKKIKKNYIDSVKFDMSGNPSEKRVTAFDTDAENKWSGDWNYTYDSLGNRLLETHKSPKQRVMDYFIYVYDSSHIQKKIWNYWVNLKLAFSIIYEMQYDAKGRLITEFVKNGSDQTDSIFSFQYDANNRLIKCTCTSDREGKDTINTISYSYGKYNRLSKKITREKSDNRTEEYIYTKNKDLVKTLIYKETTSYQYNSPRIAETKYAFTYLYR